MSRGVAAVAENAIRHFGGVLHPEAVRIVTPLPDRVPVSSLRLGPALAQFLERYEPRVRSDGLFLHQAGFLDAHAQGAENFIITTATGSGKSLCFWSWVLDRLDRDPDSTALLCFPTHALMWSQAERLVRLSEARSLAYPGGDETAYAGAVRIGRQAIGWTIWHGWGGGATRNAAMAAHKDSEAFAAARIRIATLDKAHWSLFDTEENKRFAARLRCLVLDEAHTYDGVFGANVHYFLRRVALASEIQGRPRPGLFLASATLSSARKFAAILLAIDDEREVVHIEDSTRQVIDLIPTRDVPAHLSRPRAEGLLRVVLLIDGRNGGQSIRLFMGADSQVGHEVNAIYFSESKFESKRLQWDLEGRGARRTYVTYDADLPPPGRRKLERKLNDPSVRGTTVLATSALELGVDIEGLDVCFIDQVPAGRANLLQRIGRVGRRVDRPGLVLIRLSAEPHDQQLLEDPRAAFRLDSSRPLPVPIHLDILRWRHALVAFDEWLGALKRGQVPWEDFNAALARHFRFQTAPKYQHLKDRFRESYGSLVDMRESKWVYHGFRGSAVRGKIPLVEGDREVARIDDIDVFRDAHPEAIFLGHDLNRYRVVDYRGSWTIARGERDYWASSAALGRWLPSLQQIVVRREARPVTTRGSWEQGFQLYEGREPADGRERPREGKLEFGIWDYTRTWQGYTEIDLTTEKKRVVTLDEVDQRSRRAMECGTPYPFLYPFSYRTMGWRWDFGRLTTAAGDLESSRSLGDLAGGLLEHFLADAIESRIGDIGVQLDLPGHQLRILDVTPGGNGLSEALLGEGRILSAYRNCIRTLSSPRFRGIDGDEQFDRYVLDLCRAEPVFTAEEVLHVLRELHGRWTG
jgi:superfamily II DNA/RNA helicase